MLLMVSAPLCVLGQSKKDRDKAKKLKEAASKAYAAKNYREAADGYAQALAIVANDADAHYRKGYAHFSLQELDLAVTEFSTALSQGYDALEIYRVRHYIYVEQKNYDAALADVQKGLKLSPNNLNFLLAEGKIELDRRNFPQALAAFQKASKLEPQNADIPYNLALLYQATGDVKAQETSAELALSKGTRYPGEAHLLVADARRKQKNWTGAIDAYQKAIASNRQNKQTYRDLADIQRMEGRYNDAISTLKRAQRELPNDGDLYTDLSLLWSLVDRPKDAADAGRAGVTILPNQPAGYTYLCRASNDLKEYTQAITACNGALRLKPGDGETLFYLAFANSGLNKPAEATKYFGQAVASLTEQIGVTPNDPDLWYLLGGAYFGTGQLDNAINAYKKSIDLNPKFARVYFNLGILHLRKRNKAEATAQYDKLAAMDPKRAEDLKAEIEKMK